MAKISLKNIGKHRPLWVKRLTNAVLGTTAFALTQVDAVKYPVAIKIIVWVGIGAYFFGELFKDEDEKQSKKENE